MGQTKKKNIYILYIYNFFCVCVDCLEPLLRSVTLIGDISSDFLFR